MVYNSNGAGHIFIHASGDPWNTLYAYEDDKRKLGNNIDWVFASNELAVPEWKVVARYDKERLRLTGVISSDHFMVRATITLP